MNNQGYYQGFNMIPKIPYGGYSGSTYYPTLPSPTPLRGGSQNNNLNNNQQNIGFPKLPVSTEIEDNINEAIKKNPWLVPVGSLAAGTAGTMLGGPAIGAMGFAPLAQMLIGIIKSMHQGKNFYDSISPYLQSPQQQTGIYNIPNQGVITPMVNR